MGVRGRAAEQRGASTRAFNRRIARGQQENVFGYDAVGNRLTETSTGSHPGTVSYGYDNRDRLTTEGSTAYGYDNNGNLTSKTGEATYTWDFENRLTRVALTDGSTVDHVYDVDGNRVQTKVTPSDGGTPTVTNYLVDTAGSLSQVVAETDGAGALTSIYVRADNELLAVFRPASATTWTTRYVHVDGLGSVRVLTDETGVVADTRAYEAFGTQNSHVGSDSLAYGFAGEAFETRSQLAYHRARWMDPGRGRFLGMDGHAGHRLVPITLQKYLYVGLDPVDLIDPSGLDFDFASVAGVTSMVGILAVVAHGYSDGGILHMRSLPAVPNADAILQANCRESFNKGALLTISFQAGTQDPISGAVVFKDRLSWFYYKVRAHGPWDYKQLHPGDQAWQDFGNYNFGATGVALGIGEGLLLRGAGYAQGQAGTSQPEWGNWYDWDGPFGDDPADQVEIMGGMDWAHRHGY